MKLFAYFIRCCILITCCLFISTLSYGQCPEDPDDWIINTQEKADYFLDAYPDCREFTIIKVNNRFIGDPKYSSYSMVLAGCFLGILVLLKLFLKGFELKRK